MPAKKVKVVARSGRPTRSAQPTRKTVLRSPRRLDDLKTASKNKSPKVTRKSSSKNNTRATIQDSSRAKAPRTSKLSASVYDTKGKVVGRVTLPVEIFGAEENPKLIAQAVRVFLANQRLGTASTKTRGEVQGSTRKIYRQKGTGRARHGGIRAPIFVHGGIALGPKPRDYSLSLPQKMKRQALFSALSGKLKDGEIKVVDLEKITPKTKVMAKVIKNLDLNDKILLVTPSGTKEFKNVFLSARNLEGIKILTADTLNTYEVLDNKGILLMKDAVEVLKKHFLS